MHELTKIIGTSPTTAGLDEAIVSWLREKAEEIKKGFVSPNDNYGGGWVDKILGLTGPEKSLTDKFSESDIHISKPAIDVLVRIATEHFKSPRQKCIN